MAVVARSEVHQNAVASDPALLTGPIVVRSYPVLPPLSVDDGGYSSVGVMGTDGRVYADKYYFQASCQPTDKVFSVVYQVGDDEVATADASKPFPAVGILISRSPGNTCTVQRYGACNGFANLVADKLYLLAGNGQLITPPLPDDNIEFVQQIGQALSDTTLFVNPTGQVIRRDLQNEDGTASVGRGDPIVRQAYPPENVYIAQDTGDWYTMPAATDGLTHFYVGIGPPSDFVTYLPRAVYIDEVTGGYYVQGEQDKALVPISAGRGQPDQLVPNAFRVIYINQENGVAYYG